jgi:hypothetical protein
MSILMQASIKIKIVQINNKNYNVTLDGVFFSD